MPNLFLIRVQGKFGYIDETGQIVIAPVLSGASNFSDGYASVFQPDPEGRKDRRTRTTQVLHGYIDVKGNPITPVHFHGAQPFSEGLAAVQVDGKVGYINASGEYVVEPQFESGYAYSEGLATVRAGKKCRVIDRNGNTIFEVSGRLGSCHEGLMAWENQQKRSYLDRAGETAFTLSCSAAGRFSEGLADVLQKGKLGYVDRQGEFLISPRFAYAAPFSDGLALVEFVPPGKRDWSRPQEFGYTNKQGEPAFPATSSHPGASFSEGLAAVPMHPEANASADYIDAAGKVVIAGIRCRYAGPFTHGLALIGSDRSEAAFGYINRQGAFVWNPQD